MTKYLVHIMNKETMRGGVSHFSTPDEANAFIERIKKLYGADVDQITFTKEILDE